MATLTFSYEVPNAALSNIVTDFVIHHGWTATVTDPETKQPIPNPITKAEWGRRVVRKFIVESVTAERAEKAAQRERLAEINKAKTEVELT